jgi:hypothetical protein
MVDVVSVVVLTWELLEIQKVMSALEKAGIKVEETEKVEKQVVREMVQ